MRGACGSHGGRVVYVFGTVFFSFCDRIVYVFLYHRVDDYFRVFLRYREEIKI
jgi:hypothetical protein